MPPLPGLPPLPVLDLSALLKPLTDLLGAFGTGDLAGAGDPTKIFTGLSSLLDLTVSGTTSALKAVDKVWSGAAATGAAAKMGRTAVESGMVARQGATMSVDIGAAATIVAGGLAALQAVIVKTAGLVGAALPFIWTPPGQAAALAAISAGMTEGVAVVTATKVQLLAPTATMATNGAPVPISGAPTGAVSPFMVAATALETLAVPLKSATGILGSTLAAAARQQQTTRRPAADHQGKPPAGEKHCPAPEQRVAPAGAAGAGLGKIGGLGGGGLNPREVTARYAARTPMVGDIEPAAAVSVPGPGAAHPAPVGSAGAMAPVAGAMGGAHAVARVGAGSPDALKSVGVLGDCDKACAPAVFGADPAVEASDDLDPAETAASNRLAALREELLS